MRLLIRCAMILTAVAAFGPTAVLAANRVKLCHRPPDNPENYHTIFISENALPNHLGHGDLTGSCDTLEDDLCNDQNPCTIDAFIPGTETCADDHPPVDCDDENPCTKDQCDPMQGCISALIDCTDNDLCTVDMCDTSSGDCVNPTIDCNNEGVCDAGTGECMDPCAGVICEPSNQCTLAGECNPSDGVCSAGEPKSNGTPCDDGNPATGGDECQDGTCTWTIDCSDWWGCVDDCDDAAAFAGSECAETYDDCKNGCNGDDYDYCEELCFQALMACTGAVENVRSACKNDCGEQYPEC
jgi:hypothetical protein